MEAMMGMDMDQDLGMDMDQDLGMDDDMDETQDSTAAVPVKKEAVERKRKRRTVKKSKMEMDEKGYMGEYSPGYHHDHLLNIQSLKTMIRKNRIPANPNLKLQRSQNQKQHPQRKLHHLHLRVPHRPPLLKVIVNRMLVRQRVGR
jgi:hypothetical protein